jgi:hypothetical protein
VVEEAFSGCRRNLPHKPQRYGVEVAGRPLRKRRLFRFG